MIVFFEVAMHGPLHVCAAQDPLVDEAVFQALAAKNWIWIIPGSCFVQRDGKTYNHAARKAELAIVQATAAMLSCYVFDGNGRDAGGVGHWIVIDPTGTIIHQCGQVPKSFRNRNGAFLQEWRRIHLSRQGQGPPRA
ncbi:hypothetical protein [Sinorhizobium meliloti]|uniref:hypothetical protein n=1 Tax=Rhizobium meliloti TaxID=382 RepID=UPI00129610F1|nr:hypothetical protein [Sinorhizobium meliloti]MQX92558.1 hypothetical protein [Sinorhizobium meliloti]